MKIKEIFNEEWDENSFSAFIGGKKVIINVFKNPSKSEMKSVSEVINGKRILKFLEYGSTLYVFSPRTFHQNVKRELGINVLRDFPQGVAIFEKKDKSSPKEWVADKTDHSYKTLDELKTNKIKVV